MIGLERMKVFQVFPILETPDSFLTQSCDVGCLLHFDSIFEGSFLWQKLQISEKSERTC